MASQRRWLTKGQRSSAAQPAEYLRQDRNSAEQQSSSAAQPAEYFSQDENSAEQPAAAQNDPAQQASEAEAQSFYSVKVRPPGPPAASTEDATVKAASSVEQPVVSSLPSPSRSVWQPHCIRGNIFKPLISRCQWNPDTRSWLLPTTEPLDIVGCFDWPNMLGYGGGFPERKLITSIVPTFYPDEPDHNQLNKPRLDLLVSFNDGETVRYHPRADPIWSHTPQPTEAMHQRLNLARKLARKAARA